MPSKSFGDEIEQAIKAGAEKLRARFAGLSSSSTSSSSSSSSMSLFPKQWKGLKPKKAYRTELSINDIRASAWNASQGSPKSYEFLKSEYAHLSKLANSRLRALEKANLDMFAYDRIMTFLENQGRRRFPKSFVAQDDYRGMVKTMSELVNFINAKTSTVAEARNFLERKLDKISSFTGTEYTQEQKYQLGHLLGTDSVATLLRDVRGASEEVLEALEEIALTDFDTNKLSTIIDRYLAGYNPFDKSNDYLDYDEMMDELRKYYEELK